MDILKPSDSPSEEEQLGQIFTTPKPGDIIQANYYGPGRRVTVVDVRGDNVQFSAQCGHITEQKTASIQSFCGLFREGAKVLNFAARE